MNLIFCESTVSSGVQPKKAADDICPSDYMIQKMIKHDLLQPLDFSRLPNARQYVGQAFYKQSETLTRKEPHSN